MAFVDVPNEVLRSGLEAAFIVATLGPRLRPPVPPPAPLRPFLRFQKLPTAALAAVRKVVEEDDEFRARVTAVATDETVDRASWLWLHRPEGWEAELAELVEADRDADDVPAAARALARRLEGVDAKARRLRAELTALRSELSRAQHAREQAEAHAVSAQERVDELERAGARARTRLEQSAAELAAAQVEADAARAENEDLRRQLRAAAQRLADGDQPGSEAVDVAQPDGQRTAVEEAASVPSAAASLPRRTLDALGDAAAAAAALAASLQDLAGSLAEADDELDGSDQGRAPSAPDGATPSAPARPAEASVARPGRRRALRIPRGMHVGTPEADAWLLTQAEATVVVDGYNVAKLGWPDVVLADQRERLLDALDDLAARHSTPVEVVFDGADVGPVRSSRRRRVAVRFSPPAVPADDVIREIVDAHSPSDPIIVVTNDRAVAHDVRAAGANVVTSDGLLAVARR